MHRRTWWIGLLFAIGSTCFLVGPFPGFVELVGSKVDGLVFFVGSIFFTSAAALQLYDAAATHADRLALWACLTQFPGTLLFNVSTYRAMQTAFDNPSYDQLVWAPDAYGSVLFLVSGVLGYLAVGGGRHLPSRGRDTTIAIWNLLGCIAFAVSAVGSYFVPSTGDVVDLLAANAGTSIGALCFLVGAVLLMPAPKAGAETADAPVRA